MLSLLMGLLRQLSLPDVPVPESEVDLLAVVPQVRPDNFHRDRIYVGQASFTLDDAEDLAMSIQQVVRQQRDRLAFNNPEHWNQ